MSDTCRSQKRDKNLFSTTFFHCFSFADSSSLAQITTGVKKRFGFLLFYSKSKLSIGEQFYYHVM
jgi:hypothetical protein